MFSLKLLDLPSFSLCLTLHFVFLSLHLSFFKGFLLVDFFLTFPSSQQQLLCSQLLFLLLVEGPSSCFSVFVHSTRAALLSNITLVLYMYRTWLMTEAIPASLGYTFLSLSFTSSSCCLRSFMNSNSRKFRYALYSLREWQITWRSGVTYLQPKPHHLILGVALGRTPLPILEQFILHSLAVVVRL